ncbi:MAG: hypothetical protein G01um101416_875 [Microgenomates group bacterium Gr01-1014_16]|nr:MAG: hypothetical protein G01um101416_875 [Microgenomates group bacterium Gr01-1014_16]
MRLLLDTNAADQFHKDKVVFADNDFLGMIFEDQEVFGQIVTKLNGKQIGLYQFTEFEFLRDVFAPEQRKLKEEFLSKSLFVRIDEEVHLKVFSKIMENALLLSKIFAHQNQKKHQKNLSSFVDLVLAGFLMYINQNAVLITGNKKDFPSCVFDVVSVLNKEEQDGSIRAICVISFNEEHFRECLKELP